MFKWSLHKAEASWVSRAWEGIASLSKIDLEKKHCSLLSKSKACVSLHSPFSDLRYSFNGTELAEDGPLPIFTG